MAKASRIKVVENGIENVENMPKLLQRGAVVQIASARSDSNARQKPQAYIIAQVDIGSFQLISAVDGNRWSTPFESKGLSIKSDTLIAHLEANASHNPIIFEICYVAKNVEEMYHAVAKMAMNCISKG